MDKSVKLITCDLFCPIYYKKTIHKSQSLVNQTIHITLYVVCNHGEQLNRNRILAFEQL